MKKVGKYVIISLLLLLGLCCVGLLYLFFIPNSSLFNITYINLNKKIKSEYYDVSDVSQLNINSRSYDVNLLPTDTNNIYVEVFSNSFGFVLKDNQDTKISASVKSGMLSFDINEPYGFATKNSSCINVYIPANFPIDLRLTNKNANTTVDSADIQINNLTYSTTNGDFNFNSGSVNGTLDLDLNKSTFTIGSNVITNSSDVELKITTGKFYATSSILGDIEITQNERGVIKVNECADLRENIKSAGGQINVNKLSHINVKTSDTIISIGEVLDGAIIDISNSGSVSIKTLNAYSTITTKSGNISIDNCENSAVLHTDDGDISVKSAKKTISIQTNYGNANVIFSDTAEHYTSTNNARTLYANIYNGKLTATGVEHIGVANTDENSDIEGITVTGNGRVELKMNDVCGNNKLDGRNGSVNIVVNYKTENVLNDYILTTQSLSGNVRINLMQISDHLGYTTKTTTTTPINCESSLNTLSVSTHQGDLTLLDSVMYEYGF